MATDSHGAVSAAIEALWELPCTDESCVVEPEASVPLPGAIGRRISTYSTVSKLWTFEDWERHSSRGRYLVNLITWPRSTIARAMSPVLLILALWCCCVWNYKITVTASSLGYLASPLGLLLAFRVNSVIARFHEARLQWGQLIFVARDLASTLAAAADVPLTTRLMCCRLLVSFGWTTKAMLRPDDDIASVLDTMLPPASASQAASTRKPALTLLSMIRRATQGLPLPHHVALSVQASVTDLNRLYGGMERLLSTPLSPTYTRPASRGLLLTSKAVNAVANAANAASCAALGAARARAAAAPAAPPRR